MEKSVYCPEVLDADVSVDLKHRLMCRWKSTRSCSYLCLWEISICNDSRSIPDSLAQSAAHHWGAVTCLGPVAGLVKREATVASNIHPIKQLRDFNIKTWNHKLRTDYLCSVLRYWRPISLNFFVFSICSRQQILQAVFNRGEQALHHELWPRRLVCWNNSFTSVSWLTEW